MATLPSLLANKNFRLGTPLHAHSSQTSNVFKTRWLRHSSPCSFHRQDSISCSASTSRDSDLMPESSEQLGFGVLDGRAGCVLGLSAVAGTMLAFPQHANAVSEVASNVDAWSSLVAMEPKNALSLPTWVIHVASVVEWITAMALVWRYGDTPGNSTWKGLSWGMVPLLGGAMCACTWHFFYNAQSLEILVIFQAALTVIGNFTMWIAAFRIYQASQKQPKLPLE